MTAWNDWLASIRFTLGFFTIVAAVTTTTAFFLQGGVLNPLDFELSLSQWWGILTAQNHLPALSSSLVRSAESQRICVCRQPKVTGNAPTRTGDAVSFGADLR